MIVPRIRQTAFTLVETVLALGIVVFSIVTMLAVMPLGLGTVRQAMDTTVQAQINQTITAKAVIMPFDRITDQLIDKTFYFDQEGFQQDNISPTTRFKVTVTKQDTVYPGSDSMKLFLPSSIITLKLHTTLNQGGATVSDTVLNLSNQTGSTTAS